MTEYLDFEADWGAPDAVAVYDEVSLWSSMAGLLLLANVPMRPGMSVLDVGCGAGFPLFELAQRLGPGSRAVGIDTWRQGLARAQLKGRVWEVERASVIIGDAGAMPLASSRFDLVVSNLGLNNFADPVAAVRECHRVLKPGGRIALTTNLEGHMAEFYEAYSATLEENGFANLMPALDAHVRHRASVERVNALFIDAGLRPSRVVEQRAALRFADGAAFCRHYFIKAAFLGAWKEIVPAADRIAVFAALETKLNVIAAARGELRLTIPLAYIEAERPGG